MFEHGFPPEWSTIKKLIWLVGSGIAGAAAGIWKTVTGALIHITDALASPMQKCEVTLEPIQDLHGQNAPYPAGGGSNILDPSKVKEQAAWNIITLTVEPNTAYTASADIPQSSYLLLYFNNTGTSGGADASKVWDGHSVTVTSTAEGKIYISQRVSGGTDAFSNHKIQVEKGSSATTWKPYSNICPIEGWTGCEVSHLKLPVGYTAVDYVNINDASINIDTSDFIETFNTDTLVIGVEFKINSSSQYKPIVCTTYIGENYNTTRIIRDNGNGNLLFNNNWRTGSAKALSVPTGVFNSVVIAHAGFYLNDYWESFSPFASGDPNSAHSFLICGAGSSIDYRWIYIRTTGETGGIPKMVLVPCKNSNNVAGFYDIVNNRFHTTDDSSKITAYGTLQKPQYQMSFFNVPKYNADWEDEAGTVYGGTVDVTTGVLTVDYVSHEFDGSNDEQWNDYATGNGFFVSGLSDHAKENYGDGWCNMLQTSKSIGNLGVVYGINSVYIFLMQTKTSWNISTVAELRTFLSANHLQLCYKLAEPVSYQLTPQQVSTLLGENNIWADCGDVEITYKAQA